MSKFENFKIGDKVFVHTGGWTRSKCIRGISIITPKQIGYMMNDYKSMFWKKDGREVGGGRRLTIPTQAEIDEYFTERKIKSLVNDISNLMASAKFTEGDIPRLEQFHKFLTKGEK